MTYPEIVNGLRELLSAAAKQRRVIITVDEVDKISSSDKASQFINDLKALFGIKGCYYLVSLSDDAVASFGRRGISVRDAFDSAFDEIVRIDYHTLRDSRRLIGRRVIGLPFPFVDLCHCISGGLARDTVRAARAMLFTSSVNDQLELSETCKRMLRSELKSAALTAIIELRGQHSMEARDLIAWIELVVQSDFDPDQLIAMIKSFPLSSVTSKDGGLRKVGREVAFYFYYYATVAEFFTQPGDGHLKNAEGSRFEHSSIDFLASARHTLFH